VRNRSTREERARLLERPEVVAVIGEHVLAELRLALATGKPLVTPAAGVRGR